MPKRKAIDVNKIIETFKKVNSKRETARVLKIHENTVYAALRKFACKCVCCGKQLSSFEFKNCVLCRKNLSEKVKLKRKVKIRKAICVECNERIQYPSKQYCDIHRIKHLERNEKLSKKSPRKVNGGIPTNKQKIRAIRGKYGLSAVNVWNRCNGCCEICGIAHKDRAIHIHHIDRDNMNNIESNLSAICQSCHRLVHLFTEHPNLNNFHVWLKEKYSNLSY